MKNFDLSGVLGKNKQRLKNFFLKITKNLLPKLICLALAVLITLFYRMGSVEERYINVPFKIIENSEFATAQEVPNHVRVHLRGNKEDIYSIIGDDLKVFADFSDVNNIGTYGRSIKVQRLGTLQFMTPLEISVEPKNVQYFFEKKITKHVPLDTAIQGTPADGYELVNSFVTPGYATISGPASVVEQIFSLKTAAVDISDRTTDFTIPVEVDNWHSKVSILDKDISLSIKIIRMKASKTFSGINISFNNARENMNYSSDYLTGNIKIEAPTKDMDKFATSSFKLFADLKGIEEPGKYRIPVRVIVPDTAELQGFSPEYLNITVSKIKDNNSGDKEKKEAP